MMVAGMNQGHSISKNGNAVFEIRCRAAVPSCAEDGVVCVSNSDIERQYSLLVKRKTLQTFETRAMLRTN